MEKLDAPTVAFIPVRGGSKSIPLKNIREINGRPLLYWTLDPACECEYIDKVVVFTDSNVIANVAEEYKNNKVEVVRRSEQSATDTASTEFAMLEYASSNDFNLISLIQATSPLLRVEDLNKGFEYMQMPKVDSVLSVVRQKRFIWQRNDNQENVYSVNYDYNHRPRRQEFEGYLVENGAFYITTKKLLQESKNRLSGNIRAVEMPEETYFEIDEPSDWIILQELLKYKK